MEGIEITDVATTGLVREDIAFKWKIENFSVIKENKALIELQSVTVRAGKLSGVPSEWNVFLISHPKDPKDGQEWIGIYHKLVDPKIEDEGRIYSKLNLTIKKLDGTRNYSGHLVARVDNLTMGYGFSKVIKKGCPFMELQLQEDCLAIEVRISVFTQKIQSNIQQATAAAVIEFEKKSTEDLLKRQESMYKQQDYFSDMKIITMDNKEYFVHKGILACGSTVFKAMFQSLMEEAQTGVVKVEDISSRTMNIMLHYIYAGKLLQDELASAEDIQDLAYAADKYELLDLHKICDELLTEKWDMLNPLKSLKEADALRLEKTKAEIVQFIKRWNRK